MAGEAVDAGAHVVRVRHSEVTEEQGVRGKTYLTVLKVRTNMVAYVVWAKISNLRSDLTSEAVGSLKISFSFFISH